MRFGIGLGEDRREEVVERRVVEGQRVEERPVVLGVVADREIVVRGRPAGVHQEAVHLAAVEIDPSSLVGMVGIAPTAPLEVGGELRGRMQHAQVVGVLKTRLHPVGTREPTEQMVEASILHHDDDDVVELRRLLGRRGRTRRQREKQRRADGFSIRRHGDLRRLRCDAKRLFDVTSAGRKSYGRRDQTCFYFDSGRNVRITSRKSSSERVPFTGSMRQRFQWRIWTPST